MPAPTLVIARIWVARHWGRWSCGQISRTRRSAGLHRAIDAERKRNSELVAEKLRLEQELAQAKLELKLERQNKFATNAQKNGDSTKSDSASDEAASPSADDSPVTETKKKRGAPVYHPGCFRPRPTEYDWLVEVRAPPTCP